ncbi:MAG: AraC family transcriptional regulator [bacterium]|nr:AraC family transcriptional regulator [bacterium]
MTFYEQKLQDLKKSIYKNQAQLDAVIAVRNYIDNNWESDVNLDLLSKIQCISKFHLLRLFKKYYGITPRQYLIDKRIEISKKKLMSGMSVTEACFSVGFESLGSFSVLFKTKTGKSPAQFQKEQLSRSK